MIIAAAAVLTILCLAYVLFVRPQDVPEPVPVSPIQHLEDRKHAIYDNLRDLQFEYRVGKLSDADYQKTKLSLQAELAVVLAEIDKVIAAETTVVAAVAPKIKPQRDSRTCPHCGARFERDLKFCGECGKAMTA